jgi:hypothetical protein
MLDSSTKQVASQAAQAIPKPPIRKLFNREPRERREKRSRKLSEAGARMGTRKIHIMAGAFLPD